MQTNDVQLVRLFTTKAAGGTQDDTPNEIAGSRQATFYLTIQAEAGDAVGDNGTDYTLYLSAASLSGGATTFVRRVLDEQVKAGSNNWTDVGANNGYVKLESIPVNAADFPIGDLYQFTATLLTKNGIRSTVRSNEFVTI